MTPNKPVVSLEEGLEVSPEPTIAAAQNAAVTEAVDTGGCDCIDTTDAMLAEHNAQIVSTLFGKPPRVVIATVKRDEKKRGKPPAMLATYCPFCGVRYGPPRSEATAQPAPTESGMTSENGAQ